MTVPRPILRARLVRAASIAAASMILAALVTPPAQAAVPASTGSISGTVAAAAAPGTPLSAVSVTLYDAGGVRSTAAGLADGHFVFDNLPAGSYRLGFESWNRPGNLLTPYWRGAPSLSTETPIVVADGTSVTVPTVLIPAGATISGRVTHDGAPVEATSVIPYDSTGSALPIVAITTDADGRYTIGGLWPGTYRVQFSPAYGIAAQFWSGKGSLATATPITVTAQQAVTGIDMKATSGARVSGTVHYNGSDPTHRLVDTRILLQSPAGDVELYATADSTGRYSVSQVPPGDYRVHFSGPGFDSVYYGGTVFPTRAALVHVSADQQVTGIDGTLSDEAVITGTTSYVYHGLSQKPVGVLAYAVTADGQRATVGAATPDSLGRYRMRGLPATKVLVEFTSSPNVSVDLLYPAVSEYWRDSPTAARATPIDLMRGQTVSGIDAILADAPRPVPLHDYSGDGPVDLLAIDGTGRLLSYRTNGRLGWSTPTSKQVGSGWGAMRLVVSAGDWDLDGYPDVIGVNAAGDLMLYRGNGHDGWLSAKRIGSGWGGMTAVVAAGDFVGDGRPDLLARDAAGRLLLFESNGFGDLATSGQVVGVGWSGMTTIIGGSDLTGDGFADIVARDSSGRLLVYPHTPAGWKAPTVIGTGWNVMNRILIAGDDTGDGAPDVVGRDASGQLWVYPYTPGRWGAPVRIGVGWNIFSWVG